MSKLDASSLSDVIRKALEFAIASQNHAGGAEGQELAVLDDNVR